MKQLREILTKTAKSLDAFSHPRVSIAWQDLDLVFRRVHNPSPDAPEIIGKRVEDFYDDQAQADELTAKKRKVLKTQEPLQEQVIVVLAGKRHVFDTSIEPTYDTEGNVDGLMTITIDVTDLIDAREKLKEANNRLVEILGKTLESEPRQERTLR